MFRCSVKPSTRQHLLKISFLGNPRMERPESIPTPPMVLPGKSLSTPHMSLMALGYHGGGLLPSGIHAVGRDRLDSAYMQFRMKQSGVILSRIPLSSFSPPLAMASALAAEAYRKEYEASRNRLLDINRTIREFVATEIGDVDVAGHLESTAPHLLSISFLYVDAEQLLHELDGSGFSVDSGSACSSSALEPSHVLAAMGLLTHGNIRLTLHPSITSEELDRFLAMLKESVLKLRA